MKSYRRSMHSRFSSKASSVCLGYFWSLNKAHFIFRNISSISLVSITEFLVNFWSSMTMTWSWLGESTCFSATIKSWLLIFFCRGLFSPIYLTGFSAETGFVFMSSFKVRFFLLSPAVDFCSSVFLVEVNRMLLNMLVMVCWPLPSSTFFFTVY